ncbi:MAG: Sua5/YciO/YrdC/YwlC family protein [Lachnospiraceae bacterium]
MPSPYTRRMISEGKIVAIKGIGGFHLCCDATNEEAVQRLRTIKETSMASLLQLWQRMNRW